MTETVLSPSGTIKSNKSIVVVITANLDNVHPHCSLLLGSALDTCIDFLICSFYGEAKRNLFSKYVDVPASNITKQHKNKKTISIKVITLL